MASGLCQGFPLNHHKVLCRVCPKFILFLSFLWFHFTKLWLGRFWDSMPGTQSLLSFCREPSPMPAWPESFSLKAAPFPCRSSSV